MESREKSGGTPGDAAPVQHTMTTGIVRVGCNRPAQLRKPRENALTATKRQRFLDVVAATANVKRAAEAAGVSQTSFYRLRHRDAGFDAAWRQALEDGYSALEARVLAAALEPGSDQAPGDPDRGADAADPRPFDARLALDVLRRHDAQARGTDQRNSARGYKFVPIGDVERSLLKKLDAFERRLTAHRREPGA